jgi:biotin synthase
MSASSAENATFTSDLTAEFHRLAAEYESRSGVGIQWVRIVGNRWEYRGGNTRAAGADRVAERISLGGSHGLVVYGWDRLGNEEKTKLRAAFEEIVLREAGSWPALTQDEILGYLRVADPSELFHRADEARRKYCGDEVHLRGIIEFSNHCKRDCCYCGLRKSNAGLPRYRMGRDEILETARSAQRLGYRTLVLQSGEDDGFPIGELCEIVAAVKREVDCVVTLSVGECSFEDYRALKQAGAERYLLKFETSNRELFRKLKPDSSFDARIQCLKDLEALGYQVGSGCMVGLPGQTVEDLAEDILLIARFDFDMAGLGPFIPHPQTPLGHAEKGTLDTVLRMVALARIVTRNTHLPATTATGSIHPQGRQRALQCGANVLMPNLTPTRYRALYEIYPHKICMTEKAEDCGACAGGMVLALERKIGEGYGHSLKGNFREQVRNSDADNINPCGK